jgi:hypothetical protein
MRAVLIVSAFMTLGLSSCTVYHVASTAVDVTTTAVGTTVDVIGAVVTAPFGHGDSDKKSKAD